MSKLEYNKKSIGKRVFCSVGKGFFCFIIDVVDEGHFLVKDDGGKEFTVSVFDIRYLSE